MPFPLSAYGSLEFQLPHHSNPEKLIAAVEASLRDQSPSAISRSPDGISFHGSMFRFVTSRDQLVSITSGLIRFSFTEDRMHLDYGITFTQAVVFYLAIPTLLHFLPFGPPASGFPLWQLCLFAFGINYIYTCIRFRRFLRRTIERALGGAPLPTVGPTHDE
jgi:hypothetical protein